MDRMRCCSLDFFNSVTGFHRYLYQANQNLLRVAAIVLEYGWPPVDAFRVLTILLTDCLSTKRRLTASKTTFHMQNRLVRNRDGGDKLNPVIRWDWQPTGRCWQRTAGNNRSSLPIGRTNLSHARRASRLQDSRSAEQLDQVGKQPNSSSASRHKFRARKQYQQPEERGQEQATTCLGLKDRRGQLELEASERDELYERLEADCHRSRESVENLRHLRGRSAAHQQRQANFGRRQEARLEPGLSHR